MLVFAGAVAVATQSCQKMDMRKDKEHKVVYQTMEATINANETYTYTLPANKSDEAIEIKSQETHAKTREEKKENKREKDKERR